MSPMFGGMEDAVVEIRTQGRLGSGSQIVECLFERGGKKEATQCVTVTAIYSTEQQ